MEDEPLQADEPDIGLGNDLLLGGPNNQAIVQGEQFFDELKKFDDDTPFEPYYQTDLKRFGTNVSQNDRDAEPPVQIQSGSYNNKVERQNSRRSSSASSKRSKYKSIQKASKLLNAAEEFTRRRKIWRYCTLVWVLIITLAIIISFYAFGVREVSLDVSDQTSTIKLNLSNCRLYLSECTSYSCPAAQIHLDYRSSLKTIFSMGSKLPKLYNSTQTGSTLTVNVYHLDTLRGCNMYLNYQKDRVFDSIQVTCGSQCTVVQNQGAARLKSLTIQGEDVSANFRQLAVGDLDVNINKGYFQVNNFSSIDPTGSVAYKRTCLVGNGDIILQTYESIQAEFETSSENYCFSSNITSWLSPVTKSAISGKLAPFLTPLNRQSGMHLYLWKGMVNLCSRSGCPGSISSVYLLNFDGNLYINVLDALKSTISSDVSIAKGSRYGFAVDIPLSTKLLISDQIDRTLQTTWPNLIIRFGLGNVATNSSSGQRWVYVDNPIYAIVKPWWLSFFTLGRLVENSNDISSYLSPGFCPYKPILGAEDNMYIGAMLGKYVDLTMGDLSLLKNTADPLKPDVQAPTDGFFKPTPVSFFSDEWIKVRVLDGEHDTYSVTAVTEVTPVFLIMSLSVLLAVYLAFLLALEFRTLIFKNFQLIREKHYHIEMYWRVFSKVATANRKEAIQLVLEDEIEYDTDRITGAFNKTIEFKPKIRWRELPSTTAFVDYLLTQLTTGPTSSLRRFYDIVFQEIEFTAFGVSEAQNSARDSIPLKSLKSLYQQMCFMQGYKEAELTSSESIQMLKDHSMLLQTSRDSRKPYLIRITINPVSDFNLATLKSDKKQTSLQIFVQKFCETTNFDEDKLAMETFMDKYNTFCKLNHLQLELVDQAILKSKFGIDSRFEMQETIERDFSGLYQTTLHEKPGLLSRASKIFKYVAGTQKFYTLNLEKARNVNLFLAGKLNESDVGKVRFRAIAESVILVKYWWLHDIGAVLLEILIYCIVSIPFLAIFIFQEIEHSAYSLRPEDINIYGFNVYTDDIWLVPEKVSLA